MELTADGYLLPLIETPRGPVISTNVAEIAPLAWLINLAVEGTLADLRARIERGEEVQYQSLHALPHPEERAYLLSADFLNESMRVSAAALLDILARLESLRAGWRAEHLVADRPPARAKAGGLVGLERRARELEELRAGERTVECAAEESVKRRFLLLDMEAAGLLGPDAEVAARLKTFPLLLEYHLAAVEAALYLASDDRQRYLPDARSQPVLGSPVSLDWFRLPGEMPAGFRPFEWLAFCEYVLSHSDLSGGEGELLTRLGADWWRLRWRRDDGIHPAVVDARSLAGRRSPELPPA